jgi:murein DD-endopeptidase MepM/ murein hydrolase activator NlpD
MRKELWGPRAQAAKEKLSTVPAKLRGYAGKLPKLNIQPQLQQFIKQAKTIKQSKFSRLQATAKRAKLYIQPRLQQFINQAKTIKLPKLPQLQAPVKLQKWAQRYKQFKVPVHVRFIALALVMGVMIATAVGVQAHVGSFTFVVYVDGEEIGYVTEDMDVLAFVEELEADEAARQGMDAVSRQVVEVEREQRKGATVDDNQVMDALRSTMTFDVYAYVIMVNDTSTLAVQAYEDYEQVIDDLKNAYISGKDSTVIQAIVINDKVDVRLTRVEPTELYDAETAADILLRGTDRREVYLVSRGDSLSVIASQNDMKIAELHGANPQLGGSDKIWPGDELNLIVSEPLVNVTVTEDIIVEKRIPFETNYKDDNTIYKGKSKTIDAGEFGKIEVTVRVTRVNGVEDTREIMGEEVVKEPVAALVAKGTKPVPATVGTGRFLWPVSGRGTVTSRYGPRGRGFHTGVDIASARGTGILAADNGTVIQSGWQGSYGNIITIDHGNGYRTRYAHNSANLVSVGQRVQRGQQIARMGSTGNSTGPHLHFEVLRNGSHVNPMQFL